MKREADRTAPRSFTGVSMIVTSDTRLLLGWSHRGGWQLPGGVIEPGESFEAAAVRELAEGTTLCSSLADVYVSALILDEAHGIPRLTAAARVTEYTGAPNASEPHLITTWKWHALHHLPEPLFTPSAHVLATWRPSMRAALPRAHTYPLAPRRSGRCKPSATDYSCT